MDLIIDISVEMSSQYIQGKQSFIQVLLQEVVFVPANTMLPQVLLHHTLVAQPQHMWVALPQLPPMLEPQLQQPT